MFEHVNKNGVLESHFDSISEWVSEMYRDWDADFSDNWFGKYRSYKEAFKASLSCNEYTERINKVTSKMVTMIQASIPDMQPSFDVTGLGFDVGLALSGVPECWITSTPSKEPKVVKILYHTGAEADGSSEHITLRGVAVAALIQCLELGGVSTEITTCQGGSPSGKTANLGGVTCFVSLKKSDDYFDLEKFSFAICNPAYHRRMGFAWIASKSKVKGRNDYCGNRDVQSTLDEAGKEYDLYITRNDRVMTDERKIREWVIEQCRKFGVEINYLEG